MPKRGHTEMEILSALQEDEILRCLLPQEDCGHTGGGWRSPAFRAAPPRRSRVSAACVCVRRSPSVLRHTTSGPHWRFLLHHIPCRLFESTPSFFHLGEEGFKYAKVFRRFNSPLQFVYHSFSAIFTHALPQRRIVQQTRNLLCEVNRIVSSAYRLASCAVNLPSVMSY